MTLTIFNNFSIDENGNIYKGNKQVKPYLSRGYYQIMIGRKCTSYAKLIATFLVYNESNFERITYVDGDSTNCKINNLKWISEKEYNQKHSISIKNKKLDFNPDFYYFNNVFINAYKRMNGSRKYFVSGRVYLELYDRYIRGGVSNLESEIFNSYKYSIGAERRIIKQKNVIKIINYEN